MKPHLLIGLTFLLGHIIQAQNLDQDSCTIKSLTKKEISAYQALLTFTESQINCGSSNKDKADCWKKFIESKSFDRVSGSIIIPWNLKTQNSFIGKINLEEITDSIWLKSWSFNPNQKDTSDYYYLNFNGDLKRLYSSAANDNEIWKEIWESIKSTGEISPALHSGIFNPKVNKLLYDPKMRLLMSLELMRLNKK